MIKIMKFNEAWVDDIPRWTDSPSKEYAAKKKLKFPVNGDEISLEDTIHFTKGIGIIRRIFPTISIIGEGGVRFNSGDVFRFTNLWTGTSYINFIDFYTNSRGGRVGQFPEDTALEFTNTETNKKLVLSKHDFTKLVDKGYINKVRQVKKYRLRTNVSL